MPDQCRNLQFIQARNNQLTCSADGRFLHSSFNPETEAARFVQSVQCQFSPAVVILFGGCLPWCIHPLRERFPHSKLITVQFDTRFKEYSSEWDEVYFVTDEKSALFFGENLFNSYGEEKLVTSLFISWKASESVWPEESKYAWKALKACMEKAQSILTTRNWFNIRWFQNSVRNLTTIKHFVLPEKTTLPVMVTASGPSLISALPFLRKYRESFILLAASSSISTLLFNDIVPDYCISTDGGWYATRHLRAYSTDSRLQDVPLIISAESAVPSSIMEKTPFILLSYGDSIETLLAEESGTASMHGLRNGTVSGTAAAFATTLSSGPVYMCGLDLAPGKGFQHAEPNENDVALFTGQTRIKTLESSQSSLRYDSGSLALYRDWFSNQNEAFTERVFRLVSKNDNLEKLGTMHDVFLDDLSFDEKARGKHIPLYKETTDAPQGTGSTQSKADGIKAFLTSVCNAIENDPSDGKNGLWYASLSLKRYINCLRMNASEQKDEYPLMASETVSVIKEVLSHV